MQYFTIQARSNREAIEKMKGTYGEDARILTHRGVRVGGFLGLFSSEGVEVTGYLSEDGSRKRKQDVEEEKRKILDGVKKEQTLQMLLQEIQGLRESLENRPPAAAPRAGARIPPCASWRSSSPPTSSPRTTSRASASGRGGSSPWRRWTTSRSCRPPRSSGSARGSTSIRP